MTTKTIYTEVEVDINEFLDEVTTEDLIEELNSRQESTELINFLSVIYNKKRQGVDYDKDLDEMIYQYLGKII